MTDLALGLDVGAVRTKAAAADLWHGPSVFADTPDGAFSLNLLFDRAIAAGRLSGLRLDGQWLHVGTPDAIRRDQGVIDAYLGTGHHGAVA